MAKNPRLSASARNGGTERGSLAGDQTISVLCGECGAPNALRKSLTRCEQCDAAFENREGILDLVHNSDLKEERDFYDASYSSVRPDHQNDIDWALLEEHWSRPDFPERGIVMQHLGDLKGKRILLLGNGNSDKELLFLRGEPDQLVYSDLSIEALICMNLRYRFGADIDRIQFVSMDAQDIPFATSSFDIVYGYAMVHHLPNLPDFFRSVSRVLKPGGKAVFMDDAYAPLWHHAKQTWLSSLMKYSHSKTGISPEDYRFSMTGGFKESELEQQIEAVGCVPWFQRTSLLAYIVPRGIEKLAPRWLRTRFRSGRPGRLLVRLDEALARMEFFRRNQIRLVWGLTKPG